MTRRRSNNQWSGGIAAHPAPNFRVQISAEKFVASISWDQDGILLINYIPKGHSINAEYYSFLLVHLKDVLKEKRCGNVTKVVLFVDDKAQDHRALATQKKLPYRGFQFLNHPSYSTDLAPSGYHLFPGLEKNLKGHHFSSDVEVVAAAETWLDRQLSEFFF